MDKISMALDDVVKAERKEARKPGNKKVGSAKKGGKVDASTAKLVQKLVKRALSQRQRAGKTVGGRKPGRTVVKKIVKKAGGPGRGRINRGNRNISLNQRSRTISRRSRGGQTQTIVREIRYVREPRRPQPRSQRVIVRRAPQQRVVYVQQPRRNFQRRNADPFYQPRNYLQRY